MAHDPQPGIAIVVVGRDSASEESHAGFDPLRMHGNGHYSNTHLDVQGSVERAIWKMSQVRRASQHRLHQL
jgi:hypothetical protein